MTAPPSNATRAAVERLLLAWRDDDRTAAAVLAAEGTHPPVALLWALLDIASEYVPADDLRDRLLWRAAHAEDGDR